jgi:hypothetical protein
MRGHSAGKVKCMTRLAVLVALIVLAVPAAPSAAQTWIRDTPAENVADTVTCPAGSILPATIVTLDSVYVRSDAPPVGGISYVRTSINGDTACATEAAFEVIPPPGAVLAEDVPIECGYGQLSGSAPCPTVKQPGAYGGTMVLDGRSGSPTLFTAPRDSYQPLFLYFPIRVQQPFATFQASAQASCNAEPCPPAQGNGRVQVAAQFRTGDNVASKVLYSSVGLRTSETPAGPSPSATSGPTVKAPSKAKRSSLRRGISVKVTAAAGAKISVRLKFGSRTLATASKSKAKATTTTLKLRTSRTALRRLGSKARTVSLTVSVTPPGGKAVAVRRKLEITG